MIHRSLATALFMLLAGTLAAQPEAAFVEWARGRMVALDSSGRAFRTLDRGIVASRLIGVGESVHESEPFLGFRLQLLQDLVRRHRVTALVLESGLPEAMKLDDYVQGRADTVDFNVTLPGGYGNLESIQRTMEWIREWNLGAGKKHPVGVYGADLPGRSGSMVPALDRLQELTDDPGVRSAIDAVRPTATQISAGWWRGAQQKYDPLSADAKAELTANVNVLVERVDRLTMPDSNRMDWLRRLALVVRQSETTLRLGPFSSTAPRDVAMTENTLWILGRLGKGDRAVYWAHNAHAGHRPSTSSRPFPRRGDAIRHRTRQAVLRHRHDVRRFVDGRQDRCDRGERRRCVGESGDASVSTVASRRAPFVRGAAWLAQERLMRFQTGYLNVPLGTAFDAVVYFDGATRATRVTAESSLPAAVPSR